MKKLKMPKRLLFLISIYLITAISLFVLKIGVIAGVLLIILTVAMIGKQKAALNMLRAFAILQGITLSLFPFILSQDSESISQLLKLPPSIAFNSSYDVLAISIASVFCALQLWFSFSKKVINWFTVNTNMNIMR
ncbi:hypothetical protein JQC92_03095 [Shewanella sp. 202IG2-18]|uniref:hypothetical protein n=1 Tax=Parashewanella hymeniacidonis TaxID=2807618 RepID=UPI00195FA7A0|nr:hypothetical protein [Parashewanella hymeniacidonis]MBM7071028.1 hypothetical protein [Parashewanella hymeniacidonis]